MWIRIVVIVGEKKKLQIQGYSTELNWLVGSIEMEKFSIEISVCECESLLTIGQEGKMMRKRKKKVKWTDNKLFHSSIGWLVINSIDCKSYMDNIMLTDYQKIVKLGNYYFPWIMLIHFPFSLINFIWFTIFGW